MHMPAKTPGTWTVLPGNKFSVALDGTDYVFRMEGTHLAIAEKPEQFPRPQLLYGGRHTGPNADDWKDFFKFPARSLNAGASFYTGFTAWTGSKSYIEADLHRMITLNLDPNVMGEAESDILAASDEAQWLKMLEGEKR